MQVAVSSLITRMHHVSLIVADTESALRFYRDLLGLQVVVERPDLGYPGAWLRVGEQQIHLLELPNPDPRDNRPAHGGRDRHVALSTPSLDEAAERLKAAGVPLSLSKSGRRALFCRDPDQNALEIIEVASD